MSSLGGVRGQVTSKSVELELCLANRVTGSTEAQLEPVSSREDVTNSPINEGCYEETE